MSMELLSQSLQGTQHPLKQSRVSGLGTGYKGPCTSEADTQTHLV